ncbi:MAG: 1-acyl-sn-glycerol-3-phosphate acyltransferase [Deltaproteobacteria bacterium]|nr:1-acyl-sn-glycerol-3-phosphate acyltransferase [Deltaproteobacteria bacterium]
MLDLARLARIRLSPRPLGQRLVGNLGLWLDYRLPRRTEIVLEGVENLPGHPVFFAMNHTDRYNYWPFQYQLYREKLGFTATWVKGKYYENRWMGYFLDAMNNIPLPSRGYLITTEFRRVRGRLPTAEEYRELRDLVDGKVVSSETAALLGDGDATRFVADVERLFETMVQQVVALNHAALHEHGLHVLVFPEGSRSKRCGVGRIGLAQMTQHLGATIVPVGCNGSDKLYPGNSPFSRGGRVTYRIGAPLAVDDPQIRAYRVPADVLPLSQAANAYQPQYRAITDLVMERINALLDPEYRAQDDGSLDPSADVTRFV